LKKHLEVFPKLSVEVVKEERTGKPVGALTVRLALPWLPRAEAGIFPDAMMVDGKSTHNVGYGYKGC
jgi:hypothetical protein